MNLYSALLYKPFISKSLIYGPCVRMGSHLLSLLDNLPPSPPKAPKKLSSRPGMCKCTPKARTHFCTCTPWLRLCDAVERTSGGGWLLVTSTSKADSGHSQRTDESQRGQYSDDNTDRQTTMTRSRCSVTVTGLLNAALPLGCLVVLNSVYYNRWCLVSKSPRRKIIHYLLNYTRSMPG